MTPSLDTAASQRPSLVCILCGHDGTELDAGGYCNALTLDSDGDGEVCACLCTLSPTRAEDDWHHWGGILSGQISTGCLNNGMGEPDAAETAAVVLTVLDSQGWRVLPPLATQGASAQQVPTQGTDSEPRGSDGLTPAERLDFANRFRHGIGSRPAATQGAAHDHTGPETVPLAHVFRLVGPGRPTWHHHGTFTSIEAAKAAAEWHLAIYREVQEANPSEDVEPLLPEPEWTMEQIRVAARLRVGEPIPHLVFGEDGSAFRIETVELDVTTFPDGRTFRPANT